MKENEKLVEVFIPRNGANQDPNYFVGVNGVSYILPRGKKSRVPAAAAAEIARAQAADSRSPTAVRGTRSCAGCPRLTGRSFRKC